MAKVELLAMPFAGEVLQWTGAFPVRRSEGDRDALRLARDLVSDGHAIGMFVEGTRQRFGYPGPVQPGALMIALQENVPVVPCGVYSFGWSLGSRASCAVVFGKPMRLERVPRSGCGYKEAAELVGSALIRLWRQAAEAVAGDFPDELSDGTRRSAPVPPFTRLDAGGQA